MRVEKLAELIGADFYTGVPDTQLQALCNYLMHTYGSDIRHHIIGANEGNCTAMAAGYYLATGRIPVVYMQNSGEGNIINPAASLLNDEVYAIPVIFIIGWRGEPGIHDEPQHVYQGKVTVQLLRDMDIDTFIISRDTTDEEVSQAMDRFQKVLSSGKSAAFVVRKGSLSYEGCVSYQNEYEMIREEVVRHIIAVSGVEPVVSTTGKVSRELFEIREENRQSHQYDFLTVGSMGHSSSIAFGIAIHKPGTKIWCVDGDGAVLMHMGAMAVMGASAPENIVHIIINNCAHESVGGMPTAAGSINLVSIAKACGYTYAASVDNYDDLDRELKTAKKRDGLSMIEAKCSIGSRVNLGRPTIKAVLNKQNFMEYLKVYS